MTTFSPPTIKTSSRQPVFRSITLYFWSRKGSCTDNPNPMQLLSACLHKLTDRCIFNWQCIYQKNLFKNPQLNRQTPFSSFPISLTLVCTHIQGEYQEHGGSCLLYCWSNWCQSQTICVWGSTETVQYVSAQSSQLSTYYNSVSQIAPFPQLQASHISWSWPINYSGNSGRQFSSFIEDKHHLAVA